MRGAFRIAALAALASGPIAFAAPPSPAPPPTKTAAELERLLREFLAAAGRNDLAVFERFFADDLIYTRSAGVTVTKVDILKSVRDSAAQPPKPGDPKTTYEAEDVTIRDFGDTAIVNFRLVQLQDGRRAGILRNTGTFLRRGGRWQVAAWQATRVPRSEEEARTEVGAVESAFHKSTLAADVGTLASVLDEGFIWTHRDGTQVTRQELLDDLGAGRLRYSKLETAKVTIAVHGETAVVRGVTVRQRSAQPRGPADTEPFTYFYTLTFVNRGGPWKAVAMHTSRP